MRKSKKGGHTFSLLALTYLLGSKRTRKVRKYLKDLHKRAYTRRNKTNY